jgi:hypothetical protein
LNAEGVREFQPRVGTTLGNAKTKYPTLKAFAKRDISSERFQRC